MTISRNLSILAEGVNSSGVLAATNGGTGVTTSTGSGNNVLSASPTFSGTITFPGSTTIDSSGNVGVGTTVTSNKLNVYGSIGTYYDPVTYPAIRGYISHTGNTGGFQINAQGANNSTFGAGNITFWTPSANSANGSTDATLTEKMRIDSSGNVGIGTASPSRQLSISNATQSNIQLTNTAAGSTITDGFQLQFDGSYNYVWGYENVPTVFGTNNSERARIDSSGNVGIGTASPGYKLQVYAASSSLQIESVVRNDQAGAGVAAIGFNVSSSGASETSSTKAGIGLQRSASYGGGSLCFYNNNSGSAGDFTTADEKMRIDSSGNLLVGQSSWSWSNNGTEILSTGRIWNVSNTDYNLELAGSQAARIRFYTSAGGNGTTVGSISVTTSATAYNTSSDYRLKHSVASMASGLSTVSALKPVTYKWNVDDSDGEGFIAHELQEVIPHAVTGEKDAVDAEGNIIPQGVDYSKIVVHLVAAIQELSAKNDALEARLAALETP